VAEFNPEHKRVLDEMLLSNPLVRPGKMFGFPADVVGRKLCMSLYDQGVGIKLPEQSAKKLLETDPNAVPFMPMGRAKMREWVQINVDRSEDYRQYLGVFEEAIGYAAANT
jgi:hypothetical protein